MKTIRLIQTTTIVIAVAVGLLLFGGCAENEDPAPTYSMKLVFEGGQPAANGLIAGPEGAEPVISLIVGAVLVSRPNPWTDADVRNLTNARINEITNDVIQSSNFLTIEDLPTDKDSISFLVPPDSAGNWQLGAVATREKVDVLQSLHGNYDVMTWYGFSGGGFLNGEVLPGGTTTLTLIPACNGRRPPERSGCP